MSSCEEVRKLLHDWADGELDDRAHEEVEEHLGKCPECRRHAEAIQRLKQLVLAKARRVPVPVGLEDRVRDALAAELPEVRKTGPSLIRWSRVRVAAAAVLVIAFSALAYFLTDSDPSHLVHAAMAQQAIEQHRDGPGDFRPKTEQEVLAYLKAHGLPAQLPEFVKDRVRLTGMGTTSFGEWCDAVHLRYETKDRSGVISVFLVPAEIRAGKVEEARGRLWRERTVCVCVRDDAEYRVFCMRAKGVQYSLVTDQTEEKLFDELLVSLPR